MGSLEGKKILITGGTGYLGKYLVQALEKEKAKIFILSLGNIENANEYQVDICNEEEVKQAVFEIQPDIVYHLAASIDRSRDFNNYEQIMKVNVTGTLNLLRALEGIEYENFIFTSSSEVYGNNPSPYKETFPLQPASPYSLSKAYGEQLIQTFSAIYNKNYTILRIFNFYGEGMPENFFIPQIIQTLKRNEDFSMTEGEQLRDFLYVEDVVQALLLSAHKKEALKEVFNVCYGEGISIKNLAEEIEQTSNSKGKILFGAIPYRENEIWEMIGDNAKIKEKLGFIVQNTLKEGIQKCINN